jgi:S1-C subfamily serine protease
VVRRGKEVKLKVVLGELPENPLNASRGNGARPAEQSVLGITVRDLAANRLEELGVDAGAEVIAVSGIAEDAGMRVGDVVLRMKGKVIANAEALKEMAVSAESGDVVPVLVLRAQGNSVRRSYLTLRLPEDE